MPHQHHGGSAEPGEAADDGLVVAELAIALQLDEIREQPFDIVDKMRSLGVAGDLGLHPGIKAGVGFLPELLRLFAQLLDLRIERAGGRREQVQLLDLRLEIGDRLFKLEVVHGPKASG